VTSIIFCAISDDKYMLVLLITVHRVFWFKDKKGEIKRCYDFASSKR
jgi:hypothetical protein